MKILSIMNVLSLMTKRLKSLSLPSASLPSGSVAMLHSYFISSFSQPGLGWVPAGPQFRPRLFSSGCYSLSVRLSRPTSWDRIRHYRIQRLDNGWLYISPRLTFPSLQALVDHYSELAEDICCLLKEPCALQRAGLLPGKAIPLPATVQRTPLNWEELDR